MIFSKSAASCTLMSLQMVLKDSQGGSAVAVPTAASVLSPGCANEARASPCFYGDFTCPHPIRHPLFNSMELPRERRGRQGRSVSKEEPGKSVLVCCSVSVSRNGQKRSRRGRFEGDAGLLHPKPLLHCLHLTESMAETKWGWPGLVWSPCDEMFFSTTRLPCCNSIMSKTTIKLC